jgi:hypothetical protein
MRLKKPSPKSWQKQPNNSQNMICARDTLYPWRFFCIKAKT